MPSLQLKRRGSTGLINSLIIPETVAFKSGDPAYPVWYLSSKSDPGTIKRKNKDNVSSAMKWNIFRGGALLKALSFSFSLSLPPSHSLSLILSLSLSLCLYLCYYAPRSDILGFRLNGFKRV